MLGLPAVLKTWRMIGPAIEYFVSKSVQSPAWSAFFLRIPLSAVCQVVDVLPAEPQISARAVCSGGPVPV
jgi:hypothetical protein